MRPFLLLLLFLSIAGRSSTAQTPSPTPAQAKPPAFELPKKPSKPPVTADDFVDWARWEYAVNRKRERALENLDQALKIDPHHIDALLIRGNIRADEDCRSAIADYTTVIEFADLPVNTYQYRGECKIKLGDYEGALRDFDASVDLLSKAGQVQYNAFLKRGKVKYILRDYDGAIRDFKSAFRIGRNSSAAFYGALTFIKSGNLKGALEDLEYLANTIEEITRESRKKYPDLYKEADGYPWDEDIFATPKKGAMDTAYAAIGVGGGFGDTKIEFAEFDDMIVPDNWFFPSKKTYIDTFITDNNQVIFFLLGQIYAGKNEPEKAIKAYSAGLLSQMHTGGVGRLRFERGKLFLLTGQYEPAVRDLSWAISGRTKLPDAYLERGVSLTMMKRDDLAQKDLLMYNKLAPTEASVATNRIAEARRRRQSAVQK